MLAFAVLGLLAGSIPMAGAEEPVFVPNPHPHSVVVDWVESMLMAAELKPDGATGPSSHCRHHVCGYVSRPHV